MGDPFSRTRILIGDDPMLRLQKARVAVFGIGGVGSYCAEALARAGIGTLHLYDDDTVSESNLNRQLVALHSTLGRSKAAVMAQRVLDINPTCQVMAIPLFYLPENADQVDLSQYDYVVDAIDTVTAKLDLAARCSALQVNIISVMGSGNKYDPTAFRITDISKTEGCPLARVMRKELRRRGIHHLKVVYSSELAHTPTEEIVPPEAPEQSGRPESTARKATPGSLSFVPAAAGLVAASAVIRDLGQF